VGLVYGGLHIATLLYPGDPRFKTYYNYGGNGSGAAVHDGYVYFAKGGIGLEIQNIQQPTAPVRVGLFSITNGPLGSVRLRGRYAYVACGTAGLKVIDISDPAHPALAGSYETGGRAIALDIVENHVYLVDSSVGLLVLEQMGPPLTVARTSGSMTLSWPTNSFSGVLEESDTAAPASWTPAVTGGQNPVVIPLNRSKSFYRIRQ
jgi:hypothetical protein